MNATRRLLTLSLLFLAGLGLLSATASAAPRIWGGTGSNDLGRGTLTFKVNNGRATITSLQVLMACTDTSDGSESTRAFSIGSGPTDTLNRNRFNFNFSRTSGGRLGQARLTGILRSNGRGNGRLDLNAVGVDQGSNTIVERCQAALEYRLRRAPMG